jgi:hypothetical protein
LNARLLGIAVTKFKSLISAVVDQREVPKNVPKNV